MTFTAETQSALGQNQGYNTSSVNADRFCGTLNDLALKVLETPTDQRATNILGPIIFLATRNRIEILICSCLLHNAIAKLFFVWGPDVLSPISRYQACIMPTITRFLYVPLLRKTIVLLDACIITRAFELFFLQILLLLPQINQF